MLTLFLIVGVLLITVITLACLAGMATAFDPANGGPLQGLISFVVLVLVIWLPIQFGFWSLFGDDEDTRPCHRYETGTQYNHTTKQSQTYKYCAQYGEWEK